MSGRSRGRGRGWPRGPRPVSFAADSVDAAAADEAGDSVDDAAPAVRGKGPPLNNTLRTRKCTHSSFVSEKKESTVTCQ